MRGDQLRDRRVRLRAFDWLAEQVDLQGDVLPRRLLEKGFLIGDVRVPLLGPQGIWKPRVLSGIPLSITTVPGGPYDDSFSTEGLLLYRYRGKNPGHRDNVGLRGAMERRIPLVLRQG